MSEQLSTVSSEVSPAVPGNPVEQAAFRTDIFLQRMVDACASNLAVLDESGRILYASRAWRLSSEQNTLGANTFGLNLDYLDTPLEPTAATAPEMAPLAGDIQRILDNRERQFHREYSCSEFGRARWFLVHAARLDVPESGGFRVLLTREDITRRRHAEEELRNLGGRLINAQEEERSRIARELHDDLNQRLAIMAIKLDQLKQKIPQGYTELTSHVEQLSKQAQEVCSEIHQIAYQLHPSKLDHLGLATALKSLCEELSEHQEIEIEFQQNGFPALIPQDITLCVFRIAQESLRNVIKHSGARRAVMVLKRLHRRSTSACRIVVADLTLISTAAEKVLDSSA